MTAPVKGVRLPPECCTQTTGYKETDQINATIDSLDKNLSKLSDSLKLRFKNLVVTQLSLLKYRDFNPDLKEVENLRNTTSPNVNDTDEKTGTIKRLTERRQKDYDKELNNFEIPKLPKFKSITMAGNKPDFRNGNYVLEIETKSNLDAKDIQKFKIERRDHIKDVGGEKRPGYSSQLGMGNAKTDENRSRESNRKNTKCDERTKIEPCKSPARRIDSIRYTNTTVQIPTRSIKVEGSYQKLEVNFNDKRRSPTVHAIKTETDESSGNRSTSLPEKTVEEHDGKLAKNTTACLDGRRATDTNTVKNIKEEGTFTDTRTYQMLRYTEDKEPSSACFKKVTKSSEPACADLANDAENNRTRDVSSDFHRFRTSGITSVEKETRKNKQSAIGKSSVLRRNDVMQRDKTPYTRPHRIGIIKREGMHTSDNWLHDNKEVKQKTTHQSRGLGSLEEKYGTHFTDMDHNSYPRNVNGDSHTRSDKESNIIGSKTNRYSQNEHLQLNSVYDKLRGDMVPENRPIQSKDIVDEKKGLVFDESLSPRGSQDTTRNYALPMPEHKHSIDDSGVKGPVVNRNYTNALCEKTHDDYLVHDIGESDLDNVTHIAEGTIVKGKNACDMIDEDTTTHSPVTELHDKLCTLLVYSITRQVVKAVNEAVEHEVDNNRWKEIHRSICQVEKALLDVETKLKSDVKDTEHQLTETDDSMYNRMGYMVATTEAQNMYEVRSEMRNVVQKLETVAMVSGENNCRRRLAMELQPILKELHKLTEGLETGVSRQLTNDNQTNVEVLRETPIRKAVHEQLDVDTEMVTGEHTAPRYFSTPYMKAPYMEPAILMSTERNGLQLEGTSPYQMNTIPNFTKHVYQKKIYSFLFLAGLILGLSIVSIACKGPLAIVTGSDLVHYLWCNVRLVHMVSPAI